MAGEMDATVYRDALIVLTTAAVIVPIVRRLKLSPFIAYLAAGVILGAEWCCTLGARQSVH